MQVYSTCLPILSKEEKLENARAFLDERKPLHPEWAVERAKP